MNRTISPAETSLVLTSVAQTIIEHTTDVIFVKNLDLVYVAASTSFARMAGHESSGDIIGRTDAEIFEEKALAERYVADDRRLLKARKHRLDYIEPIPDDNGKARYASTSKYVLFGPDGELTGIMGITRDVTLEYAARQHYQKSLKYLFELPEDTYASIFIDVDDWRIIAQRRQELHNCTLPPCDLPEQLAQTAREALVSREGEAYDFYHQFSPDSLWRVYESGRHMLSFSYLRHMPDESTRWVLNEIRFLHDPGSGHLCLMITIRDIHERKQAEMELIQAAETDEMTGLLNRASTMKQIRSVLEQANGQHALFMIDVDNFKSLNDTLGHQAGDEFLITLSETVKRCFRESDIVGRIGGDEFFVLTKNLHDRAIVATKAQMLLDAVSPVCARYPQVELSISIGVSFYPDNGQTIETLYTRADEALYQAKGKGKSRFIFAVD